MANTIQTTLYTDHAFLLQAIFPRHRLQTVWERINLVAGPDIPLTKETYLGNLTQAYMADSVEFERESRAAIKELASLFDANGNCVIEKNEIRMGVLSRLGHNSTISKMRYFDVYKRPSGIPIQMFVDAWAQFRTVVSRALDEPVQKTLEAIEDVHTNIK